MPLGPLLRSQYVDLASDGFLLIGRTNAVPNPCAAVDVSTWVDESYPVETVDRVTSIPGVTLPAGAPACIHNGPTAGGSSLMMDFAPLPVAPGEWLWVQFQAFCSGGDPADYAFWADIEFNAADGTFVDWLALCEDIEPPSTGFVRYGFAVQVPENAATYSLYFTNDNRNSETEPFQLADLAEPFITQILVEPGLEGVEPPPYVDATTATLTSDLYNDLSSDGGIRLHGDADLYIGGGYVDLESDGGVSLGGKARLNLGRALPPTVWSWTTPLSRGELLRTMRVRLSTLDGEYTIVDPTEFEDISIELTRKGGVDTMTFVLARDARLELGDLDYKTDCDVDYLGRQLQAWVRESSLDHGARGMRRTVTLLGWIARLKEEHEAFRRVYVDSRTSKWKTDQGPSSAANVYEVQAR